MIYFIIYMSIEDSTDLSRDRRFFKRREDSLREEKILDYLRVEKIL